MLEYQNRPDRASNPDCSISRMPTLRQHLALLRTVARTVPFDTSTSEGRSLERYRLIVLSMATSVAGRGVSAIAALVVVPIAIRYLGAQQYGLWVAISSMTAWITLCDLGLTAGLLNPIAEAHGRDDRESARGYFSTAFYSLAAIALGMAILIAAVLPAVPWGRLLSVPPGVAGSAVTAAVAIALLLTVVHLPAGTVAQVYAGYQKAYVGTAFATAGAVLSLAAVVLAVQLKASLPWVVAAASCTAAVAGVSSLGYLVTCEMPWLRPSRRFVSRRALRRLRATSVPLYLFQIGGLLVNQSQQIVLARRVGLDVVAQYDLLWRIYVLASGLILVSTQSFFPSFRESYERGEGAWMRSSFWHMVRLRMALAAAAAIACVGAGNFAFRLWLHDPQFQFPLPTWCLLAAFILVVVWQSSFLELLMVLDHIYPLISVVLVQGTITVALTWVLSRQHGVAGALLAIMVPCALLSGCLFPWFARAYLRNRLIQPARPTAAGVRN